jgi:LacI family transcriptional regulator
MQRRRQAVTIKHVAADAGVSLQTVSRVINKEPNVRAEMMERVQASITKLGYVPSIAAQRMGGSRSHLIMSLNDRHRTIEDWRERQGRDWVDQMLLGGMLTCAELGYRMIIELVDTDSDHIERELLAATAALQPDGVILTPPLSQNPVISRLLNEQGISIARIGSLSEGPGFVLTMDDERAARLATEHLLEIGHKRIAFVAGPPDFELSAWRVEGWRATMAAAGLSMDGLLGQGDFGYESGLEEATRLLAGDDPPTAIIASNDQMAIAALAAARSRGLDVPEDLSLISFDDTPVVKFTHPPLAAIALIIAEKAGRATPDDLVVVPSRLVLRSSTAPPPAIRAQ